eukprot:11102050-Alexandrium_andersonii.AAC.1
MSGVLGRSASGPSWAPWAGGLSHDLPPIVLTSQTASLVLGKVRFGNAVDSNTVDQLWERPEGVSESGRGPGK